MKKSLLLAAALLAWTASVASAGGVNLAWNDCYGGGGVVNMAFACNTNVGNNDLFVSFDPPVFIPDVCGSNQIIDLQSAGTILPAWWQFKNAGTCRQAALAARSGPGTCVDLWEGQGSPGIAAYFTQAYAPQVVPSPNRARILGSMAVPSAFAAPVYPGTEYFCFQIRINNTKTVGTGACTDCQVPVCLVLTEVLLTSCNSGDFRLFNALESNYCLWQGGAIGGAGCPGATPTINRTWGQMKSMYR